MSSWKKFWIYFFLIVIALAGLMYLYGVYPVQSIAVTAALIVILIIRFGFSRRCPECRKLFSLKSTGKELVNSQSQNMKVKNDVYNNNSEKIGHTSQWVQGTRDTYHKNFKCKHCGKTTYKSFSKDRIN